jgi:hypothetical protein
MNPQWLRQPGKRKLLLRWYIFSALLIICLVSWFLTREMEPELEPEPEPEVARSPFEACAYVITEAGVPPLEELAKQKDANADETSPNEKQGARVISAEKLMELVDSGEHPGPRILHQSWKHDQLPEHFGRWSMAWQRQLDETWLCIPALHHG